jgi:alpha-glucosidase
MSIRDLALVLTSFSISQLVRAVVYALRRTRLNARYARQRAPGAEFAVGRIEADEIHGGLARFTFSAARLEIAALDEDLVRVTWTPGELPPPYAIARSDWPGAKAEWSREAGEWELRTEHVHARLDSAGGIAFHTSGGSALLQCRPPGRAGSGWAQCATSPAGERLYGLGERAARLDLRGGRYRMWNTDPFGVGPGVDPLYLCVPVYVGLHRAGSYLVFFENPYDGAFDFRRPGLSQAWFADGALRYYFIPGPPRRALDRYSELTGRPPMPASWSMGYHHSRWGFRDQDDLTEVVRGFKEHNLALSAIHLDIDHMHGFRVLTVDHEAFPDLRGLSDRLAADGIHLVGIVDPGVKVDPGYELYQDGVKRGAFCRLPDGKPAIAPVWPGWAAFPDFTDRQVRSWWSQQYPRLFDEGISGVWHDMNEPAVFAAWGDRTLPLSTVHDFDGRGGDHAKAHNLYGLLMASAGYEGLRHLRPDSRPFMLTRSGWAGIQRYAWTWTGDTRSDWESLRQTIPTVLGLGLCGIPFAGPDIGGFAGDPDAELFIRWLQLATFMPFFRNHSAAHTPRREPWLYGEPTLSIVRDHLRLRQRLSPYLCSLAREASRTGQPIVRPLFWNSLSHEEMWSIDDAFLLGDDLLVAPVLEPGADGHDLYLPSGYWFSLYDDSRRDGPGLIRLEAHLERIPVLVRGGAILPMMGQTGLVMHVYPDHEGSAEGVAFVDAGEGYGDDLTLESRMHCDGRVYSLHIGAEGSFVPPFSWMKVTLHSMNVSQARLDGKRVELDDMQVSIPVSGKHILRLE